MRIQEHTVDWESVIREKGVRFKFFNDGSRIRVTVCYKKIDDNRCSYGVCVFNKNDKECTKERGRIIAFGRLIKGLSRTDGLDGNTLVHSIFNEIDEKFMTYELVAPKSKIIKLSQYFKG